MGLFEHFPYTNFHDLNLDWIIKTLKELSIKEQDLDYIAEQAAEIKAELEQLEQLPTEFDEFQRDVNQELLGMQNDISGLQSDFNTLQNDVQSALAGVRSPMSNIICLTDSYGTNDPENDRYSWCDQLKDELGLDANTYFKIATAGASFGDDDNTKNLYHMFETATASMATARKQAVTDIIIVSGINEWNESRQIMYSSMLSLDTYIRTNFPNAVIWLFAVQWDKLGNVRYHTMGNASANTYHLYRQHAMTLGWRYVQNISAMVYSNMYVDTVHPTTAGSRMIMHIIKAAIEGNPVEYQTNNLTGVMIETSEQTRNAGGIYFDGKQFVWSASPFSCDALPDLPSGFNGVIKLGKLVTSAIIGCDYDLVPYPVNIPCTLGIYTGEWHNVPGTASIRMINGEPELWFRNNGYYAQVPTPGYSNITNSYLYFGSVNIPLWD